MSWLAKVIEHSLHPHGGMPLITFQLRYPRFIHAEFMTHRVFSRNASSSRAIPVAKMLQQVATDPAMPVHWGKNQKGMQAREELTGAALELTKELWLDAARTAARFAASMNDCGAHKQVVNRILEPFQFINVIVTATEWDNFFELRDHPDADPNIQKLARMMKDVVTDSFARTLVPDSKVSAGWHLPWITDEERQQYFRSPVFLARLSTARNARVSYLTHEGKAPDTGEDLALYTKLVGSRPLHASPTEHPAYPLQDVDAWCKNFRGWHQFRADVEATSL